MEMRMIGNGLVVMTALILASAFLLAAEAKETKAPGESPGAEVKARFFDSAGVRPGADIYKGALLIEIQKIEFDPRWDADKWREIDPDYEARIRDTYSALFKQSLAEEFTKAGFKVVEEAEQATIIMMASILRLSINTPELEGVSPDLNRPAGAGELLLNLVRRSDQQLLARLTSFRRTEFDEASPPGESRPGRNQEDFEKLMALWARESATYLSDPPPKTDSN